MSVAHPSSLARLREIETSPAATAPVRRRAFAERRVVETRPSGGGQSMLDLSRREAFVSLPGCACRGCSQLRPGAASAKPGGGILAKFTRRAAWEADRQSIQARSRRCCSTRASWRARPSCGPRYRQSDLNSGHRRLFTMPRYSRRGPADRGQPGAQEPGAGCVHRAGEATAWAIRVVAVGARGGFHRHRSELKKRFALACRTFSPSAHTLSPRREAARFGRDAARRTHDIRGPLAASDMPRPTVK